MKGKTGASMVTRDSAARAKRRRKKRKREEKRWASLAGPVVVRFDDSVRRVREDTEAQPPP